MRYTFIDYFLIALLAVIVIAVPAMIYFDSKATRASKAACAEQGGTYFYREQLCIEVKTLKVTQ